MPKPKSKPPTTIRDLVQQTMQAKDLSPYDVAKLAGGRFHANVIYQWLGGERDIGVSKVEQIMQALNLKVVSALRK